MRIMLQSSDHGQLHDQAQCVVQASCMRGGLQAKWRRAAVDAAAGPLDFPALAHSTAATAGTPGRVLSDQVSA